MERNDTREQPIGPNPCPECGGEYGEHQPYCRTQHAKPPTGEHLVDGEFQSDKYPTCPAGKVPLSTKDVTAQDLLWIYAQRRRVVDPEFASDLEAALKWKGFQPPLHDSGSAIEQARREIDAALKRVGLEMESLRKPMGDPVTEQFRQFSLGMFTAIQSPLRAALANLSGSTENALLRRCQAALEKQHEDGGCSECAGKNPEDGCPLLNDLP